MSSRSRHGPAAPDASGAPSTPPALDVYRSVFERSPNGMAFHSIVVDESGRPIDYVFVDVNASFERLTGVSRADVLGRRATEVFPGIEREPADWIGRYGRVALGGEPLTFRQYSKSLRRWYDVSAFSPAPGQFAVVLSDVTEHLRVADALEAGDRRLVAVLNATHAQLALLDTELRFLMVNDAYVRGCGHARRDLIGVRHFELFPNAENERIFRRVLETGEPAYLDEKPFEFADQPERGTSWWNWSLVPVKGESGRVESVLLSLLDVSAQVHARRALEQAKRELERSGEALRDADRRKTEFLAVLSHELRNPLAPIQNAVWLLERAEPTSAQAQRAREVIRRQFGHLGRIVDDLLDVARITRGKIELKRTPIDLGELVRRTVDDYRAIFTARGLRVALSTDSAPAIVDADPTRMSQAVGNLLQNAAKFAASGSEVAITVRRDGGGGALVSVRDEGAGIAPDMLGRIFEPFTQADDTLDRSRGGLGIGLSLVKGFVELHGGKVEALSDGHGRGAEFRISLPGALERSAGHPVAASPATAARRRVLVVEDNPDALETLREVLLIGGHEVEVARDGQEGLDKAKAFHPDVLLCDIGLPAMDGYAVARAIRSDPALASMFLVAVTGYAAPEDRRRAADAGFDRHLGKPVSVDRIEAVLAELPRA